MAPLERVQEVEGVGYPGLYETRETVARRVGLDRRHGVGGGIDRNDARGAGGRAGEAEASCVAKGVKDPSPPSVARGRGSVGALVEIPARLLTAEEVHAEAQAVLLDERPPGDAPRPARRPRAEALRRPAQERRCARLSRPTGTLSARATSISAFRESTPRLRNWAESHLPAPERAFPSSASPTKESTVRPGRPSASPKASLTLCFSGSKKRRLQASARSSVSAKKAASAARGIRE